MLINLQVFRKGQLLADGLPGEILTQQLVQQTFDLDPRFQVAGLGGRLPESKDRKAKLLLALTAGKRQTDRENTGCFCFWRV